MGEGTCLKLTVPDQSLIISRKPHWQELEAAGHITPTDEQREISGLMPIAQLALHALTQPRA